MTKRDFELIARVVARADLSGKARHQLAADFADELAATNPRFDRDRFIAVCTRRN